MIFIGIDPGVSGGIAVLNSSLKVLLAERMPQTSAPAITLLRRAIGYADGQAVHAALELVHSSPQMGVKSAFTFGRVYGRLEMLLAAAGVAYLNPTPQRWQGALNCRTRGDKAVTLRLARHLFRSQVVVTNATADALLIAEFCRRFHSSVTR